MDAGSDPYVVNALRKGLDVIDALSRRESWSLAELVVELKQSKATLFRCLHTLESAGYVRKDPDSGRYSLGMRVFALGTVALRSEQLRWQALPPLQDLAARTGETVHVGILYDGVAVTVQVVEGTQAVRMHAVAGKRCPAHASALGKVLLACVPDAEVDAFVAAQGLKAYTTHTLASPAALKAALRRIREQGYAIDREEMELGVKCIGAAITDREGRAFAALSVSAPAARMNDERIEALVPTVKATALTISRMLGSPGLVVERGGIAA